MSKKHGPEPFCRPKKNRWCVQLGGRQINFGPDEATVRVRWHQILSGIASVQPSSALPSGLLA